MLVVVTGLGAALFLAVGFVLQQHVASQVPAAEALTPRLLIDLIRRPVWLAGIGAMILGQLLGAVALGNGSLALVEPLLATNLLFALPLAAAWRRKRLGAREWAGAVSLVVGLGLFTVIGRPAGGDAAHLGWPNWGIAGGTILAIAVGLMLASRGMDRAAAATTLAAGAGVVYGLQDALTRTTLLTLGHGIGHLFTSWYPYALVAVAVFGLLLAQSAFGAAPLPASLPAITIGEPLAGIAFGVGVFGEHLDLSALPLAGELSGVALMILGVLLVARSRVVTGEPAAHEPFVQTTPHERARGYADSPPHAQRVADA